MSELPQFFIGGNNCKGIDFPELHFQCPPSHIETENLFSLNLQKRDRIDSEELWEDHLLMKRKVSEGVVLDIKCQSMTRTTETGGAAKPDCDNTFNEFFVD